MADAIPARSFSFPADLRKKAAAPDFIALERTDGSSLLVRMMTRVEGEALRSRVCTSSPFMAGITMSITANRGWRIVAYSRKAIGSLNGSTFQPAESRRRQAAFRTDRSSSSTHTTEAFLLGNKARCKLVQSGGQFQSAEKLVACIVVNSPTHCPRAGSVRSAGKRLPNHHRCQRRKLHA